MKGRRILTGLAIVASLFIYSNPIGKAFADEEDIYSIYSIKSRIVREAINQGIDPAIALSLVKQESGFDRSAKSPVGAIGLFQLMPETAYNLGVDPYYLDQNIKGGLTYLKMMKDKFGSTKLALAAYNAGPGAVVKYGNIPPYRETQNYVRNIMGNYRHYQKHPDLALINRPDRMPVEISDNQAEQRTNDAPSLIGFFQQFFSFFT